MNTAHTDLQRLIPHPRETYLRQNETRIRSQAAAIKSDPLIALHLTLIEHAEDIYDYHEVAINHFKEKNNEHRIPAHRRYCAEALEIKLHHLDQLANLTL